MTHSNAAQSAQDQALALTDVKVHVLPEGYGFNLKTKRPFIPQSGRTSGD